MKKINLMLSLLLIVTIGSPSLLAQQRIIEVVPKPTDLSEKEAAALTTFIKTYDVYEIDAPYLHQQIKAYRTFFDLSFTFQDQPAWNITLSERNLRTKDYRIIDRTENGPVEVKPHPIHTYQGFNDRGEQVRMNITKDQIRGYILGQESVLNIVPLSAFLQTSAPNLFVVFQGIDYLEFVGKNCGVTEEMELHHLQHSKLIDGSTETVTSGCSVVDLATDADFEYFQEYGSVATATVRIEGDINLMEGLYQDQIGITFALVFQRVWSTSADPYDATGLNVAVQEVVDEWETNMTGVNRDLVHMFSGRNHGGLLGQVQALGTVCANPTESYGFSVVTPMSHEVVAHEIGHNFNGMHGDATGCGWFGKPTLMCPSPPINLNFSSNSVSTITSFVNGNCGCLVQCCPLVLNFPFRDSYEGALGANWTQDGGDDLDWSFGTGSTPSFNTGPSAAFNGNTYLFIESSSPNNPGKEANLVSSCLDLTGEPQPVLTFAYHLYGNTMGTLNVQVSTDVGATWTTIWEETGDQGDKWRTAYVPLGNFENEVIQIR
ncbi:MAG: zinc-dependent metalloprotease family protein, partial [Bacteroidota bacterium]